MPPKKKLGAKGMVLHSQSRQIVANVAQFMQDEANNGLQIPLHAYREGVLAATGISASSYTRIMKEAQNKTEEASTSFSTPHKKRPRRSRVVDAVPLGELGTIRSIINNMYIIDKQCPTLNSILQKMKDIELSFQGTRGTLWRLLKKMGFRWRKTEDNRKALIESFDIKLKRVQYLKKLTQYRQEGYYVVYNDESYIHSSHTRSHGWYDESGKGFMKPIGKGQRLIMVHAGGERGFIPNGLLIFKSGTKSGDFHDEMNHKNFMQWVRSHLLPNLPPKTLLVLDNASYHNVPVEKNITTGSLKSEMHQWLTERNIPFEEGYTKVELYNIIKSNKTRFPPVLVLDQLMEAHGHKVLRLPPYHPELNPIEKIWALVKNWVAARNVDHKLASVEALARSKFADVTAEQWANICRHVQKTEEEFLKNEHLLDTSIDDMRLVISFDTSDDSSSDDSSARDFDVTGDETAISGVELLSDTD